MPSPLRIRIARMLVVGAVCAVGPVACADTLIDNFEGRTSPAPWVFSNGPEFPGASGSLTLGTGYSGQGAHLAVNLSQGGHYVAADLTLPSPVTASAVSFWVRSPANIQVALRVSDSTGQVLQYTLNRPVEAMNVSAWYQQIVALASPTSWSGGADDGIVHGTIGGIGILATDGIAPAPVGAIDFDEVYAVSSVDFVLNPAAAVIPAPPGSGNFLSRMGVNIHFTNDPQALAAAQAAGFAWVRVDLTWSMIETAPGVYDWSSYDSLISALQARGMKALLILDYGNSLYTGTSSAPPVTSNAVSAYAAFAKAAASHFAGTGTRFEIWNEPNLSGFWPPAPNNSQYAAAAAAAIGAVHAGDPNALVTTAGLSGFDFGFAGGFLGSGGGSGADAIGIHPYGILDPMGPLTDNFANLQSTAAQYLPNPPPIWDTEWGFSSVDFSPAGPVNGHASSAQLRQGTMVAREMLSAGAVGFPLCIYYDIRDDGTDPTNPEDNFGLLASDYSTKPAMTAMLQLASVARNRIFSGYLHTTPSSLVAIRFDGAGDSVVALWTYLPGSQVSVFVPANATAADAFGNPLPIQNNLLGVSDAGGPVYVTVAGGAWLENLSVRSTVGGAQAPAIVGFVASGTTNTSVLIRGVGPGLTQFGLDGVLPDPTLVLQDSSGAVVDQSSSWAPSLASAFSQAGAFALSAGSHDDAVLDSLAPGAYTARISSQSGDSGLVLGEIYDADTGTRESRLVNVSARAVVGSGPNQLIGGFVVAGTGSETLLIRAAGPALSSLGLDGVLANPVLTLVDSGGSVIATNAGWGGPVSPGPSPVPTNVQGAQASTFSSVGAFPFSPASADAAMMVTLPPGSYSAQVSGAGGGTGICLFEIYELH